MKKIVWILALIVLFFVGDRIGGFILNKLTDSSQFRYSRLYSGTAESDILLVGNSRGLIFYQPYIEKITGKKTFNMSYNGMPIDLAKTLIQDYVDQYPTPKLMILDVTMCDRVNKQLIAGYNMYSPYSARMDSLMLSVNPKVGYAGKLSHLYRYNSEVFQRTLFHLNKTDEDWLLDRVINDFMVDNIDQVDTFSMDLNDPKTEEDEEAYVFQNLKETVDFATSKGIKVQLVINPYYPGYAKKINNLSEFRKKMEKVVGMTITDYSLAVKDRDGFGDYQHLNKKGARLFIDKMYQDGVFEFPISENR